MGQVDVDVSEWDLPPLDLAALPDEPPADRHFVDSVVLGSALGSVAVTGGGGPALDLGVFVFDQLASVHPGLAELARLGSTEFATLDATARIDALLAFTRQQAWLEARQLELLALISEQDSTAKHWCVEEVGAALRLSGPVARTKLQNSEQLCLRLPGTLQSLSEGGITPPQALAITEASYELDDELLSLFESRVLHGAADQSLTQLKRSIKRAVLSLDPRTAEQKRQRAVQDRQVRIAPADHGLAWLMALLPAADAHAIYDRIDGAARLAPDQDPRTLDQLRADALVDGVLNGITGELPSTQVASTAHQRAGGSDNTRRAERRAWLARRLWPDQRRLRP